VRRALWCLSHSHTYNSFNLLLIGYDQYFSSSSWNALILILLQCSHGLAMRKERRGRRGGQRWLAEEKNEGTKEKKRKKKIVFFCPSLHPPCAVNMRMWTMQTRWSHVRKTYAYPWQSLAPLSNPTPSFSLYPFSFPCLIARACLCKCIVVVQLLTYSSDQFFFPYLILTHHSLILSLSLSLFPMSSSLKPKMIIVRVQTCFEIDRFLVFITFFSISIKMLLWENFCLRVKFGIQITKMEF